MVESRIVQRLKKLGSSQMQMQQSIANNRCQFDRMVVYAEAVLSKLDGTIAIA